MTWNHASEPDGPIAGECVVNVGGYSRLARWNDRDRRWYIGYQFIDPRYVRGYYVLPEFENEPVFDRST